MHFVRTEGGKEKYMKKVVLAVLIVILFVIILYFALLYHARMNMTDRGGMINPDARIGEDGAYYIPDMVDGDFTYVDNAKLLERIVGDWVSEDGSYRMAYDADYTMTIFEAGVEILQTKADFAYLQPGKVKQTEFTLDCVSLKDPDGNEAGVVDYCYHSLEEGEDCIFMSVFFLAEAEGTEEIEKTIQFRKIK